MGNGCASLTYESSGGFPGFGMRFGGLRGSWGFRGRFGHGEVSCQGKIKGPNGWRGEGVVKFLSLPFYTQFMDEY